MPSSLFERASTPGQTQTGWGPRVYPFTTPGCCIAQNRCWQYWCSASIKFCYPKLPDLMLHVVPDVWGMLLECGLWFVQRHHTCNLVKEQNPFVHGRMESPNTSLQVIELNPSCLGQAHPNRPGTGPGYKNTELGCILAVLYFTSIIHLQRSAAALSGKVIS